MKTNKNRYKTKTNNEGRGDQNSLDASCDWVFSGLERRQNMVSYGAMLVI